MLEALAQAAHKPPLAIMMALGASIRIPGILHYLEYVVCDVLSASDSRFYIDGPQGEGQRWRLMSRAFDVLSAVLLNYPVHLYPALQRKVALVEASQKETLVYLHLAAIKMIA